MSASTSATAVSSMRRAPAARCASRACGYAYWARALHRRPARSTAARSRRRAPSRWTSPRAVSPEPQRRAPRSATPRHNRPWATVIPLADLRYARALPALPARRGAADRPAGRPAAAGRCATCASRSPTAATSAAATACPRRCSTATTPSCRSRSLLSFEEITRLARLFVAPRRAQAPPDRRRAAAAQAPRDAGRACSPQLRTPDGEPLDLTLTTNGSLLARKAQALQATPACSA